MQQSAPASGRPLRKDPLRISHRMNGIARLAPPSEETDTVSQAVSAIESILAEGVWRNSGTSWASREGRSLDALRS